MTILYLAPVIVVVALGLFKLLDWLAPEAAPDEESGAPEGGRPQ